MVTVQEVAARVPDPELPMVTIGDLGILRDAHARGDTAVVSITPTYTACPALEAIRADIARELRAEGWPEVEVHTVYSPAWTTDWITSQGRAKLAEAGVAPPGPGKRDAPAGRPVLPLLPAAPPRCPRCDSLDVEELSRFGPAACLSLWRCRSCAEPFEHMKAH